MTLQTDKNTKHNRPIDDAFEKVRQWMTDKEIENFSVDENHFGVLLGMILDRHKAIRKHIEFLREKANAEWSEYLLCMDESIQVSHFFYQSALCQFNDDYTAYVQTLNTLVQNLRE
ncbi:hypothetical protein [Dysgonomonas sp. GY617]|uniref:hypothetical protein n=1 Tax=Dysgonomonas sp. GY617 TaxID=2780420 RepID=UPI001883E684|nr:hypothetical protein [Dysgonomonas sp. GY617]MBF0574704.1 hypothetical protein [Dysgonomonas sp. GY617]